MAFALFATGWWMWIDVPATPQAVVVCVIVFNAAFGYSWGPIPWLYPPEVCTLLFNQETQLVTFKYRLCRCLYAPKVFHSPLLPIGHSIS